MGQGTVRKGGEVLQFDLSGPLTCTGGEEVGGRDDLGRCGQRVHHQGGRVEGRVLGREWQQWSPGQLVSFFEVFHVLYWTLLLIQKHFLLLRGNVNQITLECISKEVVKQV